jgi:Fic family protein
MKTVDGFRDYVARKIKERRQVQKILSDELGLNRRQKDVITFVSAHPNEFLTIKGHKSSHGVTRVTARKDLYDLVDRGFLSAEKFNKRFVRFRIGERLQ